MIAPVKWVGDPGRYGCDIPQEVCPFAQKFSVVAGEPATRG